MNKIKKIYNEFWEQTGTDISELKTAFKNQSLPFAKIRSRIAGNPHYYLFTAVTLIGILQLCICVFATKGECIKEFLFYNPIDPFSDMFMDYFNSLRCVFMDNPYNQAGVIYPPLCYSILSLFMGSIPEKDTLADPSSYYDALYIDKLRIRDSHEALLSYFVFFFICTLIFITVINKILRKNSVKNIFLFDICVIFSWGYLYVFDRGNFLLPAVIFILLFLFLNESSNRIVQELSLICLACAISLKIYPVFLAIILLTDKQYSRFVRTGFYSVILFFIPMAFFGGYGAICDLMQSLVFAGDRLSANYLGSNFNISSQIMVLEEITAPSPFWNILKRLLPLAVIVLGVPAAFFLKKKWKKLLLLTCIFLLFPGTTMLYNLLYLIPPLVYFISEKNKTRFDYAYAVLFAFCSITLPYVVYNSRDFDGLNITAGFILVCISMTAMTFMLIGEGIHEMTNRLLKKRHDVDAE